MGPKGNQQETLKEPSTAYEFCESCSCQRCKTIQSVGRCSKCKCDDCVDVLPSHIYRLSGKETSNEKISDEEDVSGDILVDLVTPKKRITMAKSLSFLVKKAVTDASHAAAPEFRFTDPSLGFCLVSLMTDFSTQLQTCHVIPKGIVGNDDHKMTQLEYAWGFKYDELNLNSRFNLINLEASLHLSFDRGHWALVPLDRVYIKKLAQSDFANIEEIYDEKKSFKYAFLPFPSMNQPILRLNEERLAEKMSINNPVTVHYSPYDTLQPILKSHVKPHFVIYDLMSKLHSAQLNLRQLSKGRKHINQKVLFDIETTYIQWMKEVPSSFKGDQSRTNKDNINVFDGRDDSNEAGDVAGATKRYQTRSQSKKKSAISVS